MYNTHTHTRSLTYICVKADKIKWQYALGPVLRENFLHSCESCERTLNFTTSDTSFDEYEGQDDYDDDSDSEDEDNDYHY